MYVCVYSCLSVCIYGYGCMFVCIVVCIDIELCVMMYLKGRNYLRKKLFAKEIFAILANIRQNNFRKITINYAIRKN